MHIEILLFSGVLCVHIHADFCDVIFRYFCSVLAAKAERNRLLGDLSVGASVILKWILKGVVFCDLAFVNTVMISRLLKRWVLLGFLRKNC